MSLASATKLINDYVPFVLFVANLFSPDRYCVVHDVSSITNDVCNEESSTPRK
jgi:hypothetical protein